MASHEVVKSEVCWKFNTVGGQMLSRGFLQLEKRHSIAYKRVKSLLPRRESERKLHPLSRHCDILQAVETRLSMLNLTYMKYIENNLLCFVPGKVLDEMKRVIALVEGDSTPPRTHELLQELRDLSSMAMEHFDEYILPRVKEDKEQMDERRQALYLSGPSHFVQAKPVSLQTVLNVDNISKQCQKYKNHMAVLNQNTQRLLLKSRKQSIRLKSQSVKIREHGRKIQEQDAKLREQETAISDLKKHIDEFEQKYKDLTTERTRATRDDILLKAGAVVPQSTTPNLPTSANSPSKLFSHIRPRTSGILPTDVRLELERKRKSVIMSSIPVKLSRPDVAGSIIQKKDCAIKKQGKLEFSALVENIIKTPLNKIKSRKRKSAEEIDLK